MTVSKARQSSSQSLECAPAAQLEAMEACESNARCRAENFELCVVTHQPSQ